MTRLRRRVAVVILLAGASIFQLPAQSVRPDPALQQPASGRASYDPMARGKGLSGHKGIVEATLAGVNPHNTDYGAAVEDWRKEVFENTLDEFYFWALIGMTALLGTSLMANGWLLRERERRLAITADIVAQLYNAYVTARAHGFTVIGKHNQLVEKYNRLDEEAAEMRTTVAKQTADKTNSSASEITYEVAKKERDALGSAQTEVTDGVAKWRRLRRHDRDGVGDAAHENGRTGAPAREEDGTASGERKSGYEPAKQTDKSTRCLRRAKATDSQPDIGDGRW